MKLLDLYCAAGGAAMGYHRAGFDVVGVDIKPQPRYPFRFILADALRPPLRLEGFDLIHASPPCQRYSRISNVHGVNADHPDLVAPTRLMLKASGVPWIMENVPGSPLDVGTVLCGSAFDLGALCHDGVRRQLRRHRWFESSLFFFDRPCRHEGEPIGVYGHGGGQFKTVWNGGVNRGYMGSFSERKEAMGIDWMNRDELADAIPPAYTEFLGRQAVAQLGRAASPKN